MVNHYLLCATLIGAAYLISAAYQSYEVGFGVALLFLFNKIPLDK